MKYWQWSLALKGFFSFHFLCQNGSFFLSHLIYFLFSWPLMALFIILSFFLAFIVHNYYINFYHSLHIDISLGQVHRTKLWGCFVKFVHERHYLSVFSQIMIFLRIRTRTDPLIESISPPFSSHHSTSQWVKSNRVSAE
jgi:hypothetical protein